MAIARDRSGQPKKLPKIECEFGQDDSVHALACRASASNEIEDKIDEGLAPRPVIVVWEPNLIDIKPSPVPIWVGSCRSEYPVNDTIREWH